MELEGGSLPDNETFEAGRGMPLEADRGGLGVVEAVVEGVVARRLDEEGAGDVRAAALRSVDGVGG